MLHSFLIKAFPSLDSREELEQHHISDVNKCNKRPSAEDIDEVSASDGLDAKGAKKQKREIERRRKPELLLLMMQLPKYLASSAIAVPALNSSSRGTVSKGGNY